jgi:chemotaxis protein methyltransferase CheR
VSSPTPAAAPTPSARAGPPEPDLVRIRELIYRCAGIFHPDNKLALLDDRCKRRIKVLGARSLKDYLACLTSSPVRQTELTALLNEITIGETCFFRNVAQLDALRSTVFPAIVQAKLKSRIRCLRIWSAGCSTGEEPYTLRMLLLEQTQRELKDWSLTIFATDLNERSLAQAREGFFGQHSARNLSPLYRSKYFVPHEEKLRVSAMARSNIVFRRLNLTDDAGMAQMKAMDLILCCNVLIYFDLESKRRVLRHFHDSLLPHGYLFLGNSESLYGVSDEFHLIHFAGCTGYMKSARPLTGSKCK